MKVAIVGCAPVGRECIPWDDPEWEIWGFNASYERLDGGKRPLYKRWDRWFQMHLPEVYKYAYGTGHAPWLAQQRKPIYMQKHYPDVPGSVAYPIDEIVKEYSLIPDDAHGALLTSSVAQAIALAVHFNVSDLGIYGVTANEKYGWQNNGILFWIGVASQRLKLDIPIDFPPFVQPIYGYEYNRSPVNLKAYLTGMRDQTSLERGPVEQKQGRESADFRAMQAKIDVLDYVIAVLKDIEELPIVRE